MDVTVEKAIYYGYSPGNFYVDSRQGPENYAFVHFLRPMMIRVDGQVIPVKTGAFILYAHGNRQQYYPQTVDMLEHWFRFFGNDIPEFLQELDFPMNRPFYVRDPAPADNMLKMIASAFDSGNQTAAGMGVRALLYYLAAALQTAEPENESVQKLYDLRMTIRERLDSHLTVAGLAEMINYSPSHFQTIYRQAFGVSPMQDISRMRIERARYLLTFTSYSVERIAQMLCYSSVTSFITKFRKATGVSPLRYRKQMLYLQKEQQEVRGMKLPNSIFSGCWTGGHCQGIAVDSKREYVYYSFTTMLIKTDMQGRVIGSVTGLLGHLGCIDFCEEDGRIYGSLEYKQDAIGKGILRSMGSDVQLEEAFYMAIFDVDKIDRMNMDGAADGVMTSVYLKEVLEDYHAEVSCSGKTVPHRYGCSGIDGTTFGTIPGSDDGKKYLFVAYGVYDDVSRTDNDYQVILCYDTAEWEQYERPLQQCSMHKMGPEKPDHKFFAYTGNTCYGVQNLEYDEASGDFLMAVYRGRKPQFANNDMYAIDGKAAPTTGILQGVEPETQGEILKVKAKSWQFPHGSTGMCSMGDGRFYISEPGYCDEGHFSHVRLYRWDGEHPMVHEEEET